MVFAAPLFYKQVHLRKVFAYLVGVCARFVYLVDGKHHRYVGRLGMRDGLFGGRHHAVVGGNDDNGDVGYLCTAGTHGRKGLMTGRIQERNVAPIV